MGLLWLIGLYIIRVPGAPLWALLGAVFQFVPQIGAVLGVMAPHLPPCSSGETGSIRFTF